MRFLLTRHAFDNMDEATLRAQVLIPLLQEMGYQDVKEYHGTGELGKDIVCWKADAFGGRQNLVVVAKATRMTGKAKVDKGTAGEVSTQIRQCFGSNYADPITAKSQSANEVWVVTNKGISQQAIDAISAGVGASDMRSVRITDADNLWKLVVKHLPVSVLDHVGRLQRAVQDIDSPYQPRITLTGDQTSIAFEEKTPGSAKEQPLTFKARFVTKEASDEFEEKLQHYRETGEGTEIPANLIDNFEFPDILQKFFGSSPAGVKMTLIPAPVPKAIPVCVTFRCDDGDQYVCPYLVLQGVQVGTKRVRIVSEEGIIPFRLTLDMQTLEGEAFFSKVDFTVDAREAPYNAVQYSEWLHLNNCMSKALNIQIESVETGISLLETKSSLGIMTAPELDYVAFYDRLAAVQRRTKVPIIVPDRDLTEDEVRLIEELYEIVTTGRWEVEWSDAQITVEPDATFLSSLLEGFSEDKPGFMIRNQEIIHMLFGIEIPIGPMRETVSGAKLANLEETREKLINLNSSSEPIEIILEPVTGGKTPAKCIVEYVNWLPPEPDIQF